jgi:hypothetical protein
VSPLLAYSSNSAFHCASFLRTRFFSFGVDRVGKSMALAEVVMLVSSVVSEEKSIGESAAGEKRHKMNGYARGSVCVANAQGA